MFIDTFLKNKRGNIVVIAGVVMPVLLLFLALAADIGVLYVARAKLQTMADAASLAGVSFSSSEVHVCDVHDGHPFDDIFEFDGDTATRIKMYVEIDSAKARSRARSILNENLDSSLYNIGDVTYERVSNGRVFYWGELIWRGNDYDIGKMEYIESSTEGANSYRVKFPAQVSTNLLGPLMSVFHGSEQFYTINIDKNGGICSVSSFDCKKIFESKE